MSDDASASRRTWIFQANPAKYRIKESLLLERQELWNLNQHATDVCPGDRVLIWICGKDAGIYAVGTIMTAPVMMADTVRGMAYWLDPAAGKRPKARVNVRYDKVFRDKPRYKRFLLADPALRGLSILRSPRGTNFSVTESEWLALLRWLNM